jgi:quinol monooxygenase YgiN
LKPLAAIRDEFGDGGGRSMTTVSLYVELKAKAGKEEDVARFLAGARDLVAAEPGTIAWFAARFDKNTFAIFDAFNDEAGREAHLGGQVAAALMAHAGELLAEAPQIRKAGVLADKLPVPS